MITHSPEHASLEALFESAFRGKSVILVGNARFEQDFSAMIDKHEIVVRFNDFHRTGFPKHFAGKRFTHWCVNLATGRASRRERLARIALCEAALSHNHSIVAVTPYGNDRENRLPGAKTFYPDRGIPFFSPPGDIGHPLRLRRRQHLSVGCYLAHRLVLAGIDVSVIGYTGIVSKWHDGKQEIHYLSSHPLITFYPMLTANSLGGVVDHNNTGGLATQTQ